MRRRNRCIDPYGMIHHVFVGPVTVSSGDERCVVAELGGVEDEDRFKVSTERRGVNRGGVWAGKEEWGRIGELHRYSAYRWKYITQRELDALSALREGEVDVLLTHEGPTGYFQDADSRGSPIIRRVVERLQPRYHFFGHHGGTFGADYEFWVGRTRSILLNERGCTTSHTGMGAWVYSTQLTGASDSSSQANSTSRVQPTFPLCDSKPKPFSLSSLA